MLPPAIYNQKDRNPLMAHYVYPTPLFTRFHKEVSASHFEPSHILLCFVRPEVPAQNASIGLTMRGRGRGDFHFGISCTSFGLLPETRSTPFCNHTLHFGGLTMKNTQKNKNNRRGWGKRCCGRQKRSAISNCMGVGKYTFLD